jgi:tRNA nucleotidyltransferase (CCA-adding enzyme)
MATPPGRMARVWDDDLKGALVSGPDRAYLVGGTVRDLMLGLSATDVDVAVERDGIAYAKALAERLGGSVLTHGAFGTAVVTFGDGRHVDVITARREIYPEPAALPIVEPGTIEEDLARRDFAINAMARSLPDERLLDPHGGEQDLAEKSIRVLHPRSFIDDPTRIFRAVRYESRLGFRMDPETDGLAREAIESGLVARLSRERVREELIALLDEPQAPAALLRMAELRLDQAVDPPLRAGLNNRSWFMRALELRHELELDVPRWRLGLETLVEPGADVSGLALNRRDSELVAGAAADARELAERAHGLEPAVLVVLADRHAPDAPLLALALEDSLELRDYFERLRSVRLELTGDDLAELGVPESPRVGEILAELRRRKLNGELIGRDDELAAARELIAGDG